MKTETEIFALTCAGIYRAITELENVGRARGGNQLQCDASYAAEKLQRDLDQALAMWNLEEEDEPPPPQVHICAGVGQWNKCAIYVVAPAVYCAACTRSIEVDDEYKFARQSERRAETS